MVLYIFIHLGKDPDPIENFRILQKGADPTGSGSATLHVHVYMHTFTQSFPWI